MVRDTVFLCVCNSLSSTYKATSVESQGSDLLSLFNPSYHLVPPNTIVTLFVPS